MRARRPPAGGAPPVDLVQQLEGWSAPQVLPGSPMRLPPINQRLRWPAGTLIGDGTQQLPDPSLPTTPPNIYVSDPFHYAAVKSQVQAVSQVVANTVPFLQQASSRRNFLSMRAIITTTTGIIYIDFAQSASANSPIALVQGQTLLFDNSVPQDDLYFFGNEAGMFLAYGFSNIPV